MNETYLWTKPQVLGREYLLLRENSEQGRLTFNGVLSANAWSFTRTGFCGRRPSTDPSCHPER